MLIHQVVKYLETHKRLVIPQFGAFVVKEAGHSVLFSELLKRDDGVMRELLTSSGVSQIEAAGEIDRFVFELRHAMEHGEEVLLTGLGAMRLGEEGLIVFTYDPTTINPCDVVPLPPATEDEPTTEEDAVVEDAYAVADNMADETNTPSETISTSDPLWSEAARINLCAAKSCLTHHHDAPVVSPSAQGIQIVPDELHVSPSAKLNPEPCLKGLRYGKPKKITNSYSYMDHRSGHRRIDRFLLVAIAAAVIAVAAIAFGYYHAAQERRVQEAESQHATIQSENTTDNQ